MTNLLWDNTVTTLFRCDGESPIYLPHTAIEELRWSDECNVAAVLCGPPFILSKHIQEGATLEVLCSDYGLRSAYDPAIVVMRLTNVRDITKYLPMIVAASPADSARVFLETTFTCDLEILEGETHEDP